MRVVSADRGHHRHLWVCDGCGVPPPSEPDLDHRNIHWRVSESRVGHAGDDLEEGHGYPVQLLLVDHPHEGFDLLPGLGEPRLGQWLPVYADTFPGIA